MNSHFIRTNKSIAADHDTASSDRFSSLYFTWVSMERETTSFYDVLLVDSVLYSGYCNVSCCVVILVAVVDSVCFMHCCLVTVAVVDSVCFMLCCLVTVVVVDSVCFMLCCVFSGYNEFCMFHAVFYLQ